METNATVVMKTPGEAPERRKLHFIWIADCSGSMGADGKIQELNFAIKEAIPHMQKSAEDNPHAEVLVRAIKFSRGARWHIAQPTPVADFRWEDLHAEEVTDMGKALSMVAEQFRAIPPTERGLRPVLVLISDGYPSDDYAGGLKALLETPWGKKAVRIAIGIGKDSSTPEAQEVLQRFMQRYPGDPEPKPIQANNPQALVNAIIYASTVAIQEASRPGTQAAAAVAEPADQGLPGVGDAAGPDIW